MMEIFQKLLLMESQFYKGFSLSITPYGKAKGKIMDTMAAPLRGILNWQHHMQAESGIKVRSPFSVYLRR